MSAGLNELLVVDMGNSITKIGYEDNSGQPIQCWVRNGFYISPVDALHREEFDKLNSNASPVLEVITEMQEPYEITNPSFKVNTVADSRLPINDIVFLPIKIIGGEEAEIQHENEIERPMLGEKANQATSYYSIFTAMYHLVKIKRKPEINLSLTLNLPLTEVDFDSRTLTERLKTSFFVYDNEFASKVNVVDVLVLGECFTTSVAYNTTTDGKRNPKASEAIIEGKYMVANMGAGTLDVAIFNKGRFVEGSKDTFKIGGNNVREVFCNIVFPKWRHLPTIEDSETAIRTGYLKIGAKEYDVYDLVIEAKKIVAKEAMNFVKRYMTRINLSFKQLTGVLFAGGSAVTNKVLDKKTQEERDIPSNTSFFEEYVKELSGGLTEVVHVDDPRWADLRGAYVISKQVKKLREKAGNNK